MKFKQGRLPLNFFNQKEGDGTFGLENSDLISKKNFFFNNRFFLKDDPRPILDKNYMSTCIKELIFFLNRKGFGESLNIKLLSTPTSRTFFKILIFLLSEIDTNFDFQKKVEENFSIFLKELKYPFPLPKGSLYVISSPHMWPNLLACLKWISELLQYDSFDQKKNINGLEKKRRTIWKQLGDAYFAFLYKSQKEEEFSNILFSLVKFKINQEKMSSLFWIKKLRSKFRNFLIVRRTFFLFWILDNRKLLIIEIHHKISKLKNSLKKFFFSSIYKKNKKTKNFKKKFLGNQSFYSKNRKEKETELFSFFRKFYNQSLKNQKRKKKVRKKICQKLIKKIQKKLTIFKNFTIKKKIFSSEIFFLIKRLNLKFKKTYIFFSNFFKFFKNEIYFNTNKNFQKNIIIFKKLNLGLTYKRFKTLNYQLKRDSFEKKNFFFKKKKTNYSQKRKKERKLIIKLLKIENSYKIFSDIENFDIKKKIYFFSLISDINFLKKILSKNILKRYFLFECFCFFKKKCFWIFVFMIKTIFKKYKQ
ncbi:hypothetical protein HAN_1g89 (nucleomorph) [Hemiselmis andersenii]|uniref:Kinetochore protein NDC80 n=1 Tax=Hemiselmis andersenii TaxID=464988 RepID=A9BK99_HEMAN|nr:hypothetical protein HAN_1g89 [Hemiselmis andersenii]ABW97932.1 hypothetical protein HAN_1g89 [Hemiselmis andersenii]